MSQLVKPEDSFWINACGNPQDGYTFRGSAEEVNESNFRSLTFTNPRVQYEFCLKGNYNYSSKYPLVTIRTSICNWNLTALCQKSANTFSNCTSSINILSLKLDPAHKKNVQVVTSVMAQKYKDLFNRLNRTLAYKKVFSMLWYSSLPCFDLNGVTSSSDEFLRALVGISPSDKWQEGSGTCTDVGELASRGAGVACVNLAAGYVRQHGSDEVISLGGLAETTEIMLRACETLATKKWEHLATSLYSNFGWTKGRVISSETPSYKGGSKDRAMVFAHYPAQEGIKALAARQGLSTTWAKADYAMRIRVMNMVALGYRLGECLFSDIDMLERVLEHELPKGTSNPRVRNNACLLCFDWNAYTTEKAKSPLEAPVFHETPKKAGKTKEPKKAGKGGRSSHLRTGLRFRGGDFPLLECRELFEACGWGRQWAGISVYKRQLYTLLVAAELSSAELEPALHDSVLDLELSVLDLYRSHGNVVDISSMTGFDFSYSALMEREIEFPGPDEPDELEMTDMDTLMSRAMERDDELDELGGWSY